MPETPDLKAFGELMDSVAHLMETNGPEVLISKVPPVEARAILVGVFVTEVRIQEKLLGIKRPPEQTISYRFLEFLKMYDPELLAHPVLKRVIHTLTTDLKVFIDSRKNQGE